MNITGKFSRYLQKNGFKVHIEMNTPNPDNPSSGVKQYAVASKQIVLDLSIFPILV